VRPGRAAEHSPPSSAAVMEEYSYTFTRPLGHTGPVTGSLYLYIYMYIYMYIYIYITYVNDFFVHDSVNLYNDCFQIALIMHSLMVEQI